MINETIAQIEERLTKKLKSTAPFSSVNMSASAVALWSNFLDTIATEIFTLEQLNNTFESEIEALINKVTTPTNLWWQKQILLFQYSATNPQVLLLDTASFSPYYPIINAALRIISNCSVVTSANNRVQIKVTNNGSVLDASQVIALKAYINTLDPAGIAYSIINELPDKFWLQANVYYNGQYSPVIKDNVIAAINAYLKSIPFDGIVKLSAVEDAILAVSGVTDVQITQAAGRRNGAAFVDKTAFNRIYQSYSGQIVQETTSGQTFADTLTFNISN